MHDIEINLKALRRSVCSQRRGARSGQLHDGGLPVDSLESVGGLLSGLRVLVLIIRESVAKLFVISPVLS